MACSPCAAQVERVAPGRAVLWLLMATPPTPEKQVLVHKTMFSEDLSRAGEERAAA